MKHYNSVLGDIIGLIVLIGIIVLVIVLSQWASITQSKPCKEKFGDEYYYLKSDTWGNTLCAKGRAEDVHVIER